MSKIMYLIGIPASGKSTFALKLAKQQKAEILSTDIIRLELFGDETSQKKTNLVFKTLYKKAHLLLENGKNVIIDATNIDREKRITSLKHFHLYQKECYYFTTPFQVALERNKSRKRRVDEYKLKKYFMNLQFPSYGEGWDKIHFIHEKIDNFISKDEFIKIVRDELEYEEVFEKLNSIPIFKEIRSFNQENPFHSHLLCLHTYKVYEDINLNYDFEDKLALQIAALFHDTGKPFCKVFKKMKGYYSYFLHENVSTHIAIHFLCNLGFNDDFVYKVASIIQYHMTMLHGGDEGANEVYHMLGDELLWKMYIFKSADEHAK